MAPKEALYSNAKAEPAVWLTNAMVAPRALSSNPKVVPEVWLTNAKAMVGALSSNTVGAFATKAELLS